MAALSRHLGPEASCAALGRLDALYPQPNDQNALQQLMVQLNTPRPYDLGKTELRRYKRVDPQWHEWPSVHGQLKVLATDLLAIDREPGMLEGADTRQPENQPGGKAARANPDKAMIAKLIEDITDIGPGSTKGRVRFDWAFLDQPAKEERLAVLDRSPQAFKEQLLKLWKKRDRKGFEQWVARGSTPDSAHASGRNSPPARDDGYGR